MDIRLYWTEQGSGRPLVLLHGNGEDGTYFASQMEAFSGSFRTIALDTRGHGKSPRGSAPFTLGQFAEDLKEFLDERGIGKASVLGFSDGGNIALLFALRYPSRVETLILNGANLDPSGLKPAVRLQVEAGWRLTGLLAPFCSRVAAIHERMRLMAREPQIPVEELKKITVPALVIAGTDDMIKEEHTRMIAGGLPNGQLTLIRGDHFVAKNSSREFNQAVKKFLETETGGTGI